MTREVDIAAEVLRNASEFKIACSPIREIIGDSDLNQAYQVQQINIARRIENGAKVVGKKIGLTSFAVQKQLGVDQPDYGILLDNMEIPHEGNIAFEELMQPKAEAEIAFVLKESLTGNITMDQLKQAIDYAVISIEVVGSRVENWNIRITDTIADNASASHFVLGNKKVSLNDIDLVNCKMTMSKNGEIASEGVGSACMDNPLNAALWLAQVMSDNNTPLLKGEVLLSGALGPMVNLSKGDVVEAEIESLGKTSLTVV